MEYSTGILKSSTYTGGNVISVINTNISSLNGGIHVHGSRIYCTNNLRLLMVTVSPTVHATVVYVGTDQIDAVMFYNGKHEYRYTFITLFLKAEMVR